MLSQLDGRNNLQLNEESHQFFHFTSKVKWCGGNHQNWVKNICISDQTIIEDFFSEIFSTIEMIISPLLFQKLSHQLKILLCWRRKFLSSYTVENEKMMSFKFR